jgi:hypothetical protein
VEPAHDDEIVTPEGPLYDVEIHFNPGLYLEMPEDMLHPVDPDILRETLEALQAAPRAVAAES